MLLFLSILGCGSDADYHRIDFSEKMRVAHPEKETSSSPRLRVAVAAMISPRETLSHYNALIDYIGAQAGYEVQIVQRKTYGEINALFPKNQVDLAFVCTGPYAVGQSTYGFEGLATPMIRGEPYYYSYLIVHKDSPFQSLTDLKGFVFAYTDPESNTGALVPNYWLVQINASPTFFKNITYTYSHDNSIMAVAKGLVDGAAVDGHLWEFYRRHNPFYTRQTRIIKKSQPFGSPPLVVSKFLAGDVKAEIKDVVLSMHRKPQGKKILDELMIDRFVPVEEKWYQPVRQMYTQVALAGRTHAKSQP
ncbi:MAG: phosphate/phosphite/phosphonate ABC transporter substrate-binding protein [Desulfobacteraceae bacterium]